MKATYKQQKTTCSPWSEPGPGSTSPKASRCSSTPAALPEYSGLTLLEYPGCPAGVLRPRAARVPSPYSALAALPRRFSLECTESLNGSCTGSLHGSCTESLHGSCTESLNGSCTGSLKGSKGRAGESREATPSPLASRVSVKLHMKLTSFASLLASFASRHSRHVTKSRH